MSVEIVHQPRRPDLTFLPEELVEHFSALGAQVGLRKHSPDVLGMDFAIGWRPVEIEGLPADVQTVVRASFDVRTDGHSYRGDCVLASRSLAAQEYQREQTEQLRQAQEDDRTWVEGVERQMQDLAAATGRATGHQLLVGNVPHLTDHVLGGPKLAPIVDQELRSAGAPRRGRPYRSG